MPAYAGPAASVGTRGLTPWGLLAAPVDLAMLNVDHTPYCVSSIDPDLATVLSLEWPHDEVLNAMIRP